MPILLRNFLKKLHQTKKIILIFQPLCLLIIPGEGAERPIDKITLYRERFSKFEKKKN